MRLIDLLTFLIAFFSIFSLSAQESVYLLGPGDLVNISVYDEPDLSIERIRIGMSGSLSFPLLGEVQVSGLTPDNLEIALTQRLKGPYLVNPSVTVSILEYRPFYVTGEVRKPGSYPFYPGMTVERAISIAGGFTDRASRDKIFVEHDLASGSSSDISEPVDRGQRVLPGDVITVRQGFF